MKIEKPTRFDPAWYLYLTKDAFIHPINEWTQLSGKYNWLTFTFLNIYCENDKMTKSFEFEFVILGIGFRFVNNYAFDESKVGRIIHHCNDEEIK